MASHSKRKCKDIAAARLERAHRRFKRAKKCRNPDIAFFMATEAENEYARAHKLFNSQF